MLYFLLSFVYSVEVRDSMGKIVLFFFLVPSLLLGKAMAEYSINSNYLISGNVNSTTFKVHKTRDQALRVLSSSNLRLTAQGLTAKGTSILLLMTKKRKALSCLALRSRVCFDLDPGNRHLVKGFMVYLDMMQSLLKDH